MYGKVLGRSVIFSAFYADFCLCPRLVIITTLKFEILTKRYLMTSLVLNNQGLNGFLIVIYNFDASYFIYMILLICLKQLQISKIWLL